MLGMNHWELDPLLKELATLNLQGKAEPHHTGQGKRVLVSSGGRTFSIALGLDGNYIALESATMLRIRDASPQGLAQGLKQELA